MLLASAISCVAAWLAFLAATGAVSASLCLFATGAAVATQYPLAKAQAYRALPEGSGAVNAVMTLFGVIELPLPILLGLVADHFGPGAALAALTLQPLGLAIIALVSRLEHNSVDPGGYTA